MKLPIWKGPSNLGGLGNRESLAPGEFIPKGHVTLERLEELGDRIEYVEPPEAKPESDTAPTEPPPAEEIGVEVDTESEPPPPEPPTPAPKRSAGRPLGSKNKK